MLATKAHHTEAAVRALLPHLTSSGYVISVQNGLNELAIAKVVGEARTLGAFVNFGADYLEPGLMLYGGRGTVMIGEAFGAERVTPRVIAIRDAWRDFDDRATATPNIWGYLWGKEAYGAMLFATALTNDSIADCLARPEYQGLYIALAREMLAVAEARDVTPEAFDGFDRGHYSVLAAPAAAAAPPSMTWSRTTGAPRRLTAASGAISRSASGPPRWTPNSASSSRWARKRACRRRLTSKLSRQPHSRRRSGGTCPQCTGHPQYPRRRHGGPVRPVNIGFPGKTVVVTGAAHGFGRAISLAFAERGASVWACDVIEDELKETQASCRTVGGACEVRVVDVRDREAVGRFVAEASGPAGCVHVLVNNAGGVLGQVGRPLEDVTPEEWQAIFDVNTTGAFFLSQAVAPGMKARRFGRIVINISSGAGLGVSLTGIQSYASAKAAQIGLTRQLAHELGPWGITVNNIAPGFVRSNRTTEAQWASYGEEGQRALIDRIALKRLGTVEDMAWGVLFFASDYAGWITGQVLSIDGGK